MIQLNMFQSLEPNFLQTSNHPQNTVNIKFNFQLRLFFCPQQNPSHYFLSNIKTAKSVGKILETCLKPCKSRWIVKLFLTKSFSYAGVCVYWNWGWSHSIPSTSATKWSSVPTLLHHFAVLEPGSTFSSKIYKHSWVKKPF